MPYFLVSSHLDFLLEGGDGFHRGAMLSAQVASWVASCSSAKSCPALVAAWTAAPDFSVLHYPEFLRLMSSVGR